MKTIAILTAAVLLAGCQYLGMGRDYAAKGIAQAVKAECALSMDIRRENLAAVHAELAADQAPHRSMALDCDGDGAPDF